MHDGWARRARFDPQSLIRRHAAGASRANSKHIAVLASHKFALDIGLGKLNTDRPMDNTVMVRTISLPLRNCKGTIKLASLEAGASDHPSCLPRKLRGALLDGRDGQV